MRNSLAVLSAVVCAWLAACSPQSDGPSVAGTDSVTEFLSCNDDDDCRGVGESCFCGTCTLQCRSLSDCGGEQTRCHIASAVCGEVSVQSGSVGLCTTACETDDDCSEQGTLSRCEAERCVADVASRAAGLTDGEGADAAFPPEADPQMPDPASVCESDSLSCDSIACDRGFEIEETSPGCCRCEEIDPCVDGQPVDNPVVLARVLSARFLGAPASEDFVARVSALEHSGELRCFVEELVKQPDSEVGVRAFFSSWLGLKNLINREQLTPELIVATEESSLLFAADVMQSSGGLNELLTSREVWTNASLQNIYLTQGAGGEPLNDEFLKITLPDAHRSGLFTQAAFTAVTSRSEDRPNPIHRGAEILTGLLCNELPPAPPEVEFNVPEPTAAPLTNRERYTEHSANATCAGCHSLFDPFGFGLENFDGLGRYRETDNDQLLDVSMPIVGTDFDANFDGPREFFTAAAQSAQVQRCFSRRWGNYLVVTDATVDAQVITDAVSAAVADTPNPTLASLVGIAASSEPFLSWISAGAPTDLAAAARGLQIE